MIRDPRVPLISATGSCRMGHIIGKAVAERMGRALLELGGNNAIIVMDDADPDLVTRAVLFGAVGTAGQRCTSTRRLFLQKGIAAKIVERLTAAYKQIVIGNPMDTATLMGPLIDEGAVENMMRGLDRIREQGGEVIYGGRRLHGNYVEPTLVKARAHMPILKEEIFAPILYLIEFDEFAAGDRLAERCSAGLVVGHLYEQLVGWGNFSQRARQRLRDREREYRDERRGNRRGVRRRKGNGWRVANLGAIRGRRTCGGRR